MSNSGDCLIEIESGLIVGVVAFVVDEGLTSLINNQQLFPGVGETGGNHFPTAVTQGLQMGREIIVNVDIGTGTGSDDTVLRGDGFNGCSGLGEVANQVH